MVKKPCSFETGVLLGDVKFIALAATIMTRDIGLDVGEYIR
jgi:hypothetical protein